LDGTTEEVVEELIRAGVPEIALAKLRWERDELTYAFNVRSPNGTNIDIY
jgi:hypothetical protein